MVASVTSATSTLGVCLLGDFSTTFSSVVVVPMMVMSVLVVVAVPSIDGVLGGLFVTTEVEYILYGHGEAAHVDGKCTLIGIVTYQ